MIYDVLCLFKLKGEKLVISVKLNIRVLLLFLIIFFLDVLRRKLNC